MEDTLTLSQQINAFDGEIRISFATSYELDRIARRRERGLPVHEDEVEAVLYAVAVAFERTK